MTTPYEDAIQRLRRTMAAFPDVRAPMESIAEAMNRIERDRREAVIARVEAEALHETCSFDLAVQQTARVAAEAALQVAEDNLAATIVERDALADEAAGLRAENASLEARLATALANQGSGDPMAGVEHSHLHTATTLRESLQVMSQAPSLTPGGVSVLEVVAGSLGALAIGLDPADAAWAPRLLRGRTLRIVGPEGARIVGDPAVALRPGAGDCAGVGVEFWGVSVGGGLHFEGNAGISLAFKGGTKLRAQSAFDATTGGGDQ